MDVEENSDVQTTRTQRICDPSDGLEHDALTDCGFDDPEYDDPERWLSWTDADIWELGPPVDQDPPADPAAAALNEIRCCAAYFAGDPCIPTRHLEAAADTLERLLDQARNDPPEPFDQADRPTDDEMADWYERLAYEAECNARFV